VPVVAVGARHPAKWTGDHSMGIRAHIRGGSRGPVTAPKESTGNGSDEKNEELTRSAPAPPLGAIPRGRLLGEGCGAAGDSEGSEEGQKTKST